MNAEARPHHVPAPVAPAERAIPAPLRQLVMPQLEQFGCTLHRVGTGVAARADSPVARGVAWAQAAGPSCLAIYHDLRIDAPLGLVEQPRACICLCSADAATTRDARLPRRPRMSPGTRALFAYARPDATERYDLEAHARYEACSLLFLPDFFAEAGALLGHGPGEPSPLSFEALAAALPLIDPDALPRELARAFSALGRASIEQPGCALHVRARALEALAIVADHAQAARQARARHGERAQRDLVRRARELVDASLDRPLTLDELAGRTYASRTQLCEAFRRETGESLGRYVRRRRMERACELLATTGMSAAEVGRAVGYAHPGSFTEAFERACGAPPSAWRAARAS